MSNWHAWFALFSLITHQITKAGAIFCVLFAVTDFAAMRDPTKNLCKGAGLALVAYWSRREWRRIAAELPASPHESPENQVD